MLMEATGTACWAQPSDWPLGSKMREFSTPWRAFSCSESTIRCSLGWRYGTLWILHIFSASSFMAFCIFQFHSDHGTATYLFLLNQFASLVQQDSKEMRRFKNFSNRTRCQWECYSMPATEWETDGQHVHRAARDRLSMGVWQLLEEELTANSSILTEHGVTDSVLLCGSFLIRNWQPTYPYSQSRKWHSHSCSVSAILEGTDSSTFTEKVVANSMVFCDSFLERNW